MLFLVRTAPSEAFPQPVMPNPVIPESQSATESESFKDMLSQFEKSHSPKRAEGGQGCEGTVITVNAEAAVLDYLERPIPGLFATGEITGGFFYLNYPAGAGLMRGAVFGRLAGTPAARFSRG